MRKTSPFLAIFALVALNSFAEEAKEVPAPPELLAVQERHAAAVAACAKQIDGKYRDDLAKLKKKAFADNKPELVKAIDDELKDPQVNQPSKQPEVLLVQDANKAALEMLTVPVNKGFITELVALKKKALKDEKLELAIGFDHMMKGLVKANRAATPTNEDIRGELMDERWTWDDNATLLFAGNGVAKYNFHCDNWGWGKVPGKVNNHWTVVSTTNIDKKFSWRIDDAKKHVIKGTADKTRYIIIFNRDFTAGDVYEGDKNIRHIKFIGSEAKPPPPDSLLPKEFILVRKNHESDIADAIKKVNEKYVGELDGMKRKAMTDEKLAVALAIEGEIKAVKNSRANTNDPATLPPELTIAQERHKGLVEEAIKVVNAEYLVDLEKKKKKAMAEDNLELATAFNDEIKKIKPGEK